MVSVAAQQSAAAQPSSTVAAEAPQRPLTSLNNLQGLPVAEIHIHSAAIENPAWMEPLLAQKANEPLDKYKVRESVQALYNTGRFSVIEVQAQRNSKGEIVLVFNARENFFFGSILVEGSSDQPSGTQLLNASKLNLGEQFSEEKIAAGIEGMQHILQENGYFRAAIQPFYDWNSKDQEVKVRFFVTKGERARVGHVVVTGSPGYDANEILETAKLHPGDEVSASRTTRALQRLRKKYQGKNRLEAQVSITHRDYRRENNTLDYTFDIVRGPVVDVKVEGANLRKGLVKKYVPIYQENAVDDDLLSEGSRNIRDYFQTKGYFDAKVGFTEKTDSAGERTNVIFDINQGERHKVLDLEINGNKYFPRETIRERMQIQPAGGLQLHGLYSQSMLAHDVRAIEGLYRSNGFLQVKATSSVQDESLMRSRSESALKPPKTTLCTAPTRAQASIAIAASGTSGM